MAGIKCPYCGSKYVDIKSSSGNFAGAEKKCYCQACTRSFALNAPTVGENDVWLMTFYNETSVYRRSECQGSIYKTATGYKAIQKDGNKEYEFDGRPGLKVVRLPFGSDRWMLQYNGFRSPNDPKGVLFLVEAFKLNPELDKLAEESEAMRIAKRYGDEKFFYDISRLTSLTILQDIRSWLLPHMGYDIQEKKGGCYLTSACTKTKGLPDDCYELQSLRAFRDEYLKSQPGGEADIQEYYRLAPRIVAAIDNTENADAHWGAIYDELIAPCVEMIAGNKQAECYDLYKRYTLKLQAEFL